VEGVTAKRLVDAEAITPTWKKGRIPVLVDPQAELRKTLRPDVIVDAIMAKKNLGTTMSDAPLVIGLGPGFSAGTDVHLVIETNRGHDLGRLIWEGPAEPDTGVPVAVGGHAGERVLRAPEAGRFDPFREIGEAVEAGEVVAEVNGVPMKSRISGVLRGVLREGTTVHKGMKSGDVDARGNREACFTISDKARAIGGSVLEGILATFNH
jgi:xanthine dehydrogenase accessory factor